jgi:tRNA pseudouridine55 synthase
MTSGIHLVHKPVGPTSFSIVQGYLDRMPQRPGRRALRVCHGGTLDPFASGLMLILIEPATKLFDHVQGVPKVYRASVRWGIETDNDDPTGKVVATGDASNVTAAQLDAALETFKGWRDQIPPATSNKRVGGERAYVRAHRGEVVALSPSRVYLHQARWISHNLPHESTFELTVRGGYYVRALARDLGRKLGCSAHLSQLTRTAIGPWTDPGPERAVELHGREILPWCRTRLLDDQEVGQLRKGNSIPIGALEPADWSMPAEFVTPATPIRGFHQDRFRFLLREHEHALHPISAFKDL